MFGYAPTRRQKLMPRPSAGAQLCRQLTAVRKSGKLPYLRPDGKSQVTVEYDETGPARAHRCCCRFEPALRGRQQRDLTPTSSSSVIQAVLPPSGSTSTPSTTSIRRGDL